MRPSNVSKIKKAGPLELPWLTLKAPVPANVLATIPVGPNGGAIGNNPGTGHGMVGTPDEIHGIWTTSGTMVPSPVYSVEVLVFWLLTQNGLPVNAVSPHPSTRFGSV